MDIIDAHHHFWDLDRNYHPWLCDDEPIQFRYGDYSAIRRNYLPANLIADAGRFNVINSVYVETEWDPADPIGESRWAQMIHNNHGLPGAIVAQAWLDAPNAGAVIAEQAQFPIVRSVRHKPSSASTYRAFVDGQRSAMQTASWRHGYEALAKHGLHFDLQTPYWHLPEAFELATLFPSTLLILNHAGLPADRSEEGLLRWRDAMSELAQAPNVRVKISGLGQLDKPWTVASNRTIIRFVIDTFGVDRCMFASNFPVDSLCADFDTIFSGFDEIVSDRSEADRRQLFVHNAQAVYCL